MRLRTQLAALRAKRGIGAAELARQTGVSRQTIYAMEAARYVPNTAVALRLARALDAAVEEIFCLETPPTASGPAEVEMLGSAAPGMPVQICPVGARTFGVPSVPAWWQLPPSDGVVLSKSGAKATVRLLDEEHPSNRLLIAGCDPAMSVLARHVRPANVDLVLAGCNSSEALRMLKNRQVHIAGTHLPSLEGLVPKGPFAVITYAEWEEGLVVASGNPKKIRGIEDLVRKDVTIVSREAGAGSRLLLDRSLKKLGIAAAAVRGYRNFAPGHLAAAWHVYAGLADGCIATQAAARAFGLDFRTLASERYDLVMRKEHLRLPDVARLLDTLGHLKLRRELESLGGYKTNGTGRRVA